MTGKTIILINSVIVGYDRLNRPVYEDRETEVEDVLYAPGVSDDIVSSTDLTGKKMVYTLAIPKGDAHEWKNCKVKLPSFPGLVFKSFGFPAEGIEELVPTRWHKKVTVELYE